MHRKGNTLSRCEPSSDRCDLKKGGRKLVSYHSNVEESGLREIISVEWMRKLFSAKILLRDILRFKEYFPERRKSLNCVQNWGKTSESVKVWTWGKLCFSIWCYTLRWNSATSSIHHLMLHLGPRNSSPQGVVSHGSNVDPPSFSLLHTWISLPFSSFA